MCELEFEGSSIKLQILQPWIITITSSAATAAAVIVAAVVLVVVAAAVRAFMVTMLKTSNCYCL
jgi:hypothetical protein